MSAPAAPADSAALFEQTAAHDHDPDQPLRGSEAQRIADTLAMIPAGMTSALDVGCGPGTLLHRLPIERSYGTDLGRVGLRRVKRPAVRSSIYELPFADASVDLITCCEVLEHLEPSTLPAAAAELYRVARRSVLISVPYREDLLKATHRCPQCGTEFHLNGHRQSLDEESLRPLFPAEARLTFAHSWKVRPWSPALVRLRARGLGLWKHSAHTFCPSCGNRAFRHQHDGWHRALAWRAIDALNAIRHPFKTKPSWLLLRVDKPD